VDGQSIYNLARSIADDGDVTFQTQADWASALQQGYASYQQLIAAQLPSIYEKRYDFTVNATAEYDLDGILFGATPSEGNRLYKITKMHNVNVGSTPDFGGWVQPATSMEELWAYAVGGAGAGAPGAWGSWRWFLQDTKLLFSCQLTQQLRLYYIPSPTIDWATAIATPNIFIDNTPDFAQQAIAYYAFQAYAIKDFQQNPVAQQRFDGILLQIKQWLAVGRNGDASRWVQPGRQRSPWGSFAFLFGLLACALPVAERLMT